MITARQKTARILLLDPAQSERRSLSLAAADDPFVMTETNTLESALEILAQNDIHLFLIHCDSTMPAPPDLVRSVRRAAPSVEILLILPGATTTQIAGAINAGAFDCLPEIPPTETMVARARRAIEHRELKVSLTAVREHVAMNYSFDNFIGISKAAVDLRETLGRLAATDIPVLITGPAGVGKTLCASILHHHSNRRDRALIIADCAAPEPILTPELFGSPNSDRPGLLRQADRSTLLLENIDHLPASVQEKLAEFTRTFTLPGESSRVNVRLLATTAQDAADLVHGAGLRRDLVTRLSVITVTVPALNERPDDIEMLLEYFLRRIAAETGRSRLELSRAAADRLVRYTWPGNVRELENTLRRAAALTSGELLDADSIVFVGRTGADTPNSQPRFSDRPTNLRLSDNQRELIEKALVENAWNYTQTAQELGIGRTTLWRKVKKYNLKPGPEAEQVGQHDG